MIILVINCGSSSIKYQLLDMKSDDVYELLAKGISFKAEAARLLKQAEADMYAPLKTKLADVLRRIGTERGYAFIINTDGDALPFVNDAYGEDITAAVIEIINNS